MIAAGLFVSDHNNINPLPESERLQSRPLGSGSSAAASLSFFPIVMPASQEVSVEIDGGRSNPLGQHDPLRPLPISREAAVISSLNQSNGIVHDQSSGQPSNPSQGEGDARQPSSELPVDAQTLQSSSASAPRSAGDARMLFTIDIQPSSDSVALVPPPRGDVIMADESHVVHPSEPVEASQSVSGQDPRGTAGSTTASASAIPPVVSRICRDCAFEIFLHELYPWWSRERKRVLDLADSASHQTAAHLLGTIPFDDDGDESDDGGFAEEGGRHPRSNVPTARLPSWVGTRKDCEEGRHCTRQTDIGMFYRATVLLVALNVFILSPQSSTCQRMWVVFERFLVSVS